jgi:phosphoglycolate phosphatase-like HAD superfamily hydrolase
VRLALHLLDATAEEAAFVGDSPFDVDAGRAAGVFTIGVSWGKIHSEERLLEAGADVIAHSPEELLGLL